jgi:hypothetical protein
MRVNQQIQLFIQFISYVWYLLHVSALHCHLQGAFLVSSVTRPNTPIYSILSTAPQLIISHKALGTLNEDGNVMPKHVGATIHN